MVALQELCVGSPKFQSNYYGTQLISVTTTFYECEQGKIWDGKSSCMPGASPYTGTDTSAYVDVPGLVSSGDKQKALPCSSMDGVVRAALIANPQATFALKDSSDPSVKPTFFTVKNADAVVASEEVQEIVMEYFDTRVFDFTNVTVFNWTQDISQSTRKIISKQTRLIQRPNGVSTLVRQLSADGLCWFGIATNSSDAPKTPDEAQRAVTQEAVAELSAMLPAGSGTAPDLADGEECDFTTLIEVGAATAGGAAAVSIVGRSIAAASAPDVGSLAPIAIGATAALMTGSSVVPVVVVAFAIAAGALILGGLVLAGAPLVVVIDAVVANAINAVANAVLLPIFEKACFPAAATAYLALSAGVTGGIGTKRMDQLMLGDSLMTMHALNGSATASPVYLFGHKDAATHGSFVQLQLQSGQTVQLTRAHFLPTFAGAYATASYELPAACNTTTDSCPSSSIDSYHMLSQVGAAYEGMPCVPSGYVAAPAADGGVAASVPAPPSMRMKRAGDVDVDSDLLCAFDNSTGTFALSRVLSKETVLLQGLYAPFTMTGSAAPIVGSLVPIAIGTAAALVGMGSVAAVTVVAFAIAAGAIILGAVLVIGVAAAITALIDGACFPAAATAYLALSAGVTGGIGTKRMDQLMLGDSLMTMHALNGSATASPVYLFGHKDAATYGSFVQLQLQSGQTVQLTRAHFLPTFAAAYATASYELPAACNTTTDSCPSSSIDSYRMLSQVGAAYEGMPCVPSGHVAAPAADGDVAASAPAPPSMKMKRAGDVDVDSDLPFTMTGDLVVNGVLVSAHSDWYLDRVMPQSHVHRLPAIYQATMAPARLAYRLGGAPLMEFLDSKLHLVELASAVSL
eukprot:jgi/Sobl393_1/18948/SZX74249.1